MTTKNTFIIENSKLYLKPIIAKETYSIRHPVLREGHPIEDCVFEGDELETTIHVGLFYNKKLVGVVTFLEHKNSSFSETIQYQLRGMAILKAYQGLKLGDAIMKYGEQMLKEKRAQLIWCNTRKTAIGFYKKNGYKIIGESFEVPKIGTHYMMYKPL